jgi:CDP-alcohol phosphatidyltransferase
MGEQRIATFKSNYKLLLAQSQHVNIFDICLTRYIAYLIASLSFFTRTTPPVLTCLGFLTFTSGGLIAFFWEGSSWTKSFAIAATWIVAFGFDGADGSLARLRKRYSPFGSYFDYFTDAMSRPAAITLFLIPVFNELNRMGEAVSPAQVALTVCFFCVAYINGQYSFISKKYYFDRNTHFRDGLGVSPSPALRVAYFSLVGSPTIICFPFFIQWPKLLLGIMFFHFGMSFLADLFKIVSLRRMDKPVSRSDF